MAQTKMSKFIAEAARKGAALGDCGRMCKDCAFKEGTDANNDEMAVEAALHCLQGVPVFNCHTSVFGDAGVKCVGFQYALQYFEREKQ